MSDQHETQERVALDPGVPVRTASDVTRTRPVPEATVVRLAGYLRALRTFADGGRAIVSSDELAMSAGVKAPTLRKDLAYLGSNGVRGVGYDVPRLTSRIAITLGLDQRYEVALIGAGNLGHALAGYGGFSQQGFHVAAIFDQDPARVGEKVGHVRVQHIDDLDMACAQFGITIGVIATPAETAQQVCDRLGAAGVRCVLNFAPVQLTVPDGVDLREVDLAAELQVLSFHMARRSAGGSADGLDPLDELDLDDGSDSGDGSVAP